MRLAVLPRLARAPRAQRRLDLLPLPEARGLLSSWPMWLLLVAAGVVSATSFYLLFHISKAIDARR